MNLECRSIAIPRHPAAPAARRTTPGILLLSQPADPRQASFCSRSQPSRPAIPLLSWLAEPPQASFRSRSRPSHPGPVLPDSEHPVTPDTELPPRPLGTPPAAPPHLCRIPAVSLEFPARSPQPAPRHADTLPSDCCDRSKVQRPPTTIGHPGTTIAASRERARPKWRLLDKSKPGESRGRKASARLRMEATGRVERLPKGARP